jgi:hypothetical protein
MTCTLKGRMPRFSPFGCKPLRCTCVQRSPLDVRPVSDPLRCRPLGVNPLSVYQLYIRRPNLYPYPPGRKLKGCTPKKVYAEMAWTRGPYAKKVHAERAYAEGTAYSRGAEMLVLHL